MTCSAEPKEPRAVFPPRHGTKTPNEEMRTSYRADVLRLEFQRRRAADSEISSPVKLYTRVSSTEPYTHGADFFSLPLFHSDITFLPFTDIFLWYSVGGMSSQT